MCNVGCCRLDRFSRYEHYWIDEIIGPTSSEKQYFRANSHDYRVRIVLISVHLSTNFANHFIRWSPSDVPLRSRRSVHGELFEEQPGSVCAIGRTNIAKSKRIIYSRLPEIDVPLFDRVCLGLGFCSRHSSRRRVSATTYFLVQHPNRFSVYVRVYIYIYMCV